MTWDNSTEALRKLSAANFPHWDSYLGFYSSWLGGYFREPWAMLLPVDDHGFHRGDGVFEAVRIHEGAYFDLGGHLERLQNSARALGMELPGGVHGVRTICVELAKRCATAQGILRLYITRGPGGFSPSPREVVGHQIYAAITKIKPPDKALYAGGCTAMISTVPAKEAFWSQIKSCNYLQNVLMKKECLERGVDMAISCNAEGRLSEGSTENMMLVTGSGRMLVPKFDYTLRGTTVRVVMQLASVLVRQGELQSVEFGDVTAQDLRGASEAAFVGTTLGVLPIAEVDGHPIGSGVPGPVSLKLNAALMEQMSRNSELRTPF